MNFRILALLLFVTSNAHAQQTGSINPTDETVRAILEASQIADVRTVVNGRLATIAVKEGDKIAKGDLLAQIDPAVQTARVELARVAAETNGMVLKAKTALEQARQTEKRVRRAVSKRVAKKWELVQATQAVSIAQADLQIARDEKSRLQSQLALEQATLGEFSVKAPFEGTVLEIFKSEGETIDTQTVLMKIGNFTNLKATAFVPLEWIDRLNQNKTISATVMGANRDTVSVNVTGVDQRIDPASQTVRVSVELANSARKFLVGSQLVIGFE